MSGVWKGPVDWNFWIDYSETGDGEVLVDAHVYINNTLVWRSIDASDINAGYVKAGNKDEMEQYFCGMFAADLREMLRDWKDGKLTNG